MLILKGNNGINKKKVEEEANFPPNFLLFDIKVVEERKSRNIVVLKTYSHKII